MYWLVCGDILFTSIHSVGGFSLLFDFSKIHRIHTLTQYLGYQEDIINNYINDQTTRNIKIFSLIRRSKERKVVQITDPCFANILKSINEFLQTKYKPSESVIGYVKGRNICDNAIKHIGKLIIIKADIKDFFYSINKTTIQNIFANLGAEPIIANALASLVTYDNILYPGLQTSPVLSNMVLEQLDSDFQVFATKNNCDYSRYADDITFSTNTLFDTIDKTKEFFNKEISQLLSKYGFCLNQSKFKVMKKGQTQIVTGLSVTDTNCPRIPRKIKRKIKTACYLRYKLTYKQYCDRVKWCSPDYLEGLLHFYNKIEPDFILKMQQLKRFGRKK